MSETELAKELALGFETADLNLDHLNDEFVILDESGDEVPTPMDLAPTPIQSILKSTSKQSTSSSSFGDFTDEESELGSDLDDSSDSDDTLRGPFFDALPLMNQFLFFVRAFMPENVHPDVHLVIVKYIDHEFRWKLGLLVWKPYSMLTELCMAKYYGPNSTKLQDINFAISCCVAQEKMTRQQLRDDIIKSSTDKSRLVWHISKVFSKQKQGSYDFTKDKKQIHDMMHEIVTAPSTDSPRSTRARFMQFTNSNERNLKVMALSSIATPSMALSLSRSLSITMGSQLTLQYLSEDISAGLGSPEEFTEQKSSSFLFDELQRENPDRPLAEFQRLHALLKANLATTSQYSLDYILIHIALRFFIILHIVFNFCTVSFEHHIEDTLLVSAAILIRKECSGFIPVEKRDSVLSLPFTFAKAVDIKTKKCLVMNIVNVFAELRMAAHYVEMLGRKWPSFIMDSTAPPNSVVKPEPLEPFCSYGQAMSINEFLNNFPLFVSLRENTNFNQAIDRISSSVTHIIEKVMRPLPFQPTHIINDTYSDFLLYTTAISKFVQNKVHSSFSANDDYFGNIVLNSLACPIQLDFFIIPQCVSEPKYEYENMVITDYNVQCDRLPFGIGDDTVGDIGKKLHEFDIEFIEEKLFQEPAQFHKTLSRSFQRFCQLGKHGKNKSRHKRFIFIIDRRNPKHDGKYFLNNNEKNWTDRLYVFCPPKFNEISRQCDNVPEGFIDRTMEYLLPLKKGNVNRAEEDVVIGGNSVANGYVFGFSYHLYQENKLKAYFHNNGCVQRFTKDEIRYYFPRLFMKVNGQFQDEMEANRNSNQMHLDLFREIDDVEHREFHQQTMR